MSCFTVQFLLSMADLWRQPTPRGVPTLLCSSASYQTVIPAVVATRPSLQRYQSQSGCYDQRGCCNPSRPIAAVNDRDGLQQPRGQHLQMLCIVCLSYLSTTVQRGHLPIVGKVGHVLFFCTGAGTHNFQIASKGLQYRVKRRVQAHIRPPFTLQKFQCSIETIFAF